MFFVSHSQLVSEDPFFDSILSWYITQRICDEAVDDSLAAMKLIPYWFVTSKMIKKLYPAL